MCRWHVACEGKRDMTRIPQVEMRPAEVVLEKTTPLTVDDAGSSEPKERERSPDETLAFLDVLAQALESRESRLRKHAQRVGFYADLLAEELGLSEDVREHIRISSFLHDIGKIRLSNEDKDRARLHARPNGSQEEQHPETGARLVGALGFEGRVADAIRHHHEHWNGSGTPGALEGEAIPLAARVIAVVDTFDRLTCDRPQDDPISTKKALAEIHKQSGEHFDPAVVTAFVSMVENGYVEIGAGGLQGSDALSGGSQ
jgi:putative nucleotidyltransferase with HDIG domain